MSEVETELYKVGVPVKTRHNEVAPSQYEIAPVFENANVATDHQMMTMETMRRIGAEVRPGVPAAREAVRRRQRIGQAPQLVDERRRGAQPAQPGREPARQHAVPRVLRGGAARGQQVAGPAARQHRQRGQRSPARRERSAAGDPLDLPRRHADRHLRADREGRREVDQAAAATLDTGVMVLPKLPRDAGDRNRTSPFAFTGNKFEFRAVSSGQSIAYPEHRAERGGDRIARLHGDRAREADARAARRSSKAVAELLPKVIKENKRIIFNGNNYSKEWEKEAGKRGLLNLKNTVDALPQLVTKEVVGAVREVQGAQRARAARALRDHARDTTTRPSTSKAS